MYSGKEENMDSLEALLDVIGHSVGDVNVGRDDTVVFGRDDAGVGLVEVWRVHRARFGAPVVLELLAELRRGQFSDNILEASTGGRNLAIVL
jgi:hypothetical protein